MQGAEFHRLLEGTEALNLSTAGHRDVRIPLDDVQVEGTLNIPAGCSSVVVFAHGSGSSRHSPRNRYVAQELSSRGFATLLLDLLTPREDEVYRTRFNIDLLASRLTQTMVWLKSVAALHRAGIGLFGASTGAAAALRAAASGDERIRAVVSRGGRPDLALDCLHLVRCPTLLLVGGHDPEVLDLNRLAFERLTCEKHLEVIPGATHLFEEPGKLEEVAALAGDWFERYVGSSEGPR